MTKEPDAGRHTAATAALALVRDGMRLGLGTGSTVRYFLDALAGRVRREGLRVLGIPTSVRTEEQARALGIPLADFATIERLDLAIDGADEVERGTLRLIKGLGGALLREKIVAEAASQLVVIADPSKIVDRLGARTPLPVEVVRFGHEATARRIAALGAAPALRMSGNGPFLTDSGNLIYDCAGLSPMLDPRRLQGQLRAIAGVIETGLFLDGPELVLIGHADGRIDRLERPA
ncbi:ribose-5-phosphate isomerase RpiA [Roseomonas chloroacetimidivorans]|uniref:ribose-5-phosphate isomerase RpiA n=1 Tax=Roseomonas chloroacetimidivorans TaxID=1766656 RepID=UPI003C74FFB1